ncbi:IS200/IS605 family transposase [Phnomibacter sp. MR]|uniref:IS200/IS605 family transposase n=1 Tax=Phnomibacter sp. MR TaxID=3042318 RepID=UPI003A809885
MPMLQVYIHAVWSTLLRQPLMTKEKRAAIFHFIEQYAASKEIHILALNGVEDHIHCLFQLNPNLPLAKHLQLLKGGSAFWINHESNLFSAHFSWAQEYFAGSVSADRLPKVKQYIATQEEHHKKQSFQEEYQFILQHYLQQQTQDSGKPG